ncbi:type II toxin-antitoxin system prevent-host-death family antitoxin [Nocardia transvalensis]|uniref:type II toxin-antitoxin system prevent-host-death family antitoxin n=1 Tax=Nocardia transvalensis TaxID=37333 RepID=UPI001894A403|nr:type II toxin-antitoxin system prevent-host-death family antitoxin [Nocardia transvalensis]MBF6329520.1 type II toxin-antitoxin system prevent-host-death family antitoxin [Nocardia transvalensis]
MDYPDYFDYIGQKEVVRVAGDSSNENDRGERFDIAWPLAEAKARFSELIDKVEREGPQVISKRGKEVAVVVPVEEWVRKSTRAGSLARFLVESPLRDSGLVVERDRSESPHRSVEL